MRRILGASALALALISCGGHSAPLPAAPQQAQLRGSATFTIRIPKGATLAAHPAKYISPNTGSLRISLATVNGSAPVPAVPDVVAALTSTSPGCNSTSGNVVCTVGTNAVIGTDVYNLTIYASANGTGTPLGTAQISTTVSQGVADNVSVTFGGVPASIALSKSLISMGDDGGTHTATFTVTATDASGATIILPGNYATSIGLAISGDTAGALSLSSSSLAAPGASSGANTITLSYDSSKALTTASVSATSGSASASLTVVPIVPSRTSVKDMFASGSSQSMTVSESGYSGVFSISGVTSIASYVCVPASCAPSAAGGTVTITFTPTAAGTATAVFGDTNGGSLSIPVGVGSSTSPTKPISSSAVGGAAGISLGSNPNGDIYVGGYSGANPVIYYFDPTACSSSCTPSSFAVSIGGLSGILYDSATTNVYAEGSSGVGKYTSCPSTCTATTISTKSAYYMAKGDDGNLWMTTFSSSVYRVSPSGTTTTYTFTGYAPNIITAASDGTLWFTNSGKHTIGHFDPSACTASACTITSYATTHDGGQNNGIAVTPSGVWIAEYSAKYIAHIVCTSTCTLSELSLPSSVSNLSWVMALPDGLIYVNDLGTNVADIFDPSSCTTSCSFVYQSATGYGADEAVVGADGAVWGLTNSGGLFRLQIP